jgi:hypothetical protein
LRAAHVQSGHKALLSGEFNITEALGTVLFSVTHKSHIGHITAREEIGDLALGDIEGKVGNVCGIRRAVGDGNRSTSREAVAVIGCDCQNEYLSAGCIYCLPLE